ncbi:MAG: isoamylase, partial [Vicinamibacteraceae bacterium]|nr:isoamylase [Vicinamibacteraceae bacterium]
MPLRLERGRPLPLGCTLTPDGVNLAVVSRHAERATLRLEASPGGTFHELRLDPRFNRTGDVWHALITGVPLAPLTRYAIRFGRQAESAPPILHRFDEGVDLVEPYARRLVGGEVWGAPARRTAVVDAETGFDWGRDQPLNTPLADSIIYELHVGSFTRGASSGVAHAGTFLGLTGKIPYLKQLGVTAVELLPVCEFDETANVRRNPITGAPLLNAWGYDTIAFFAPKASYAATGDPVTEFKEMVKRFHEAGIEVILDMVFNHTAEGNERGPTLSFRGLDNVVYYLLDPATGAYRDFTGTGNTLNCNHPVVRQLIVDCLHYWVVEMHVDGFRFDLASVLGRGADGAMLANPPLLEHLAADPVLASTKLIAEAWDAGGAYQVGSFPAWGRWAEWNGHFRDDVRRFVRGDAATVPALAARLAGSADLYGPSGRQPFHSVNFVTCHDGFTLADLVSYGRKHNEANGEDNRDGADENHSANHGVEGPTDDPAILALRERQVKNFLTLLFTARGVPMLLAGDEMGRTQQGNNNAYCHDSPLVWIDWDDVSRRAGLLRFVQELAAIRHTQAALRRPRFDRHGVGIEFHGVRLNHPDWSDSSHSLAMFVRAVEGEAGGHIYLIANAWREPLTFELPALAWGRLVDTALPSPDDVLAPPRFAPLVDPGSYTA